MNPRVIQWQVRVSEEVLRKADEDSELSDDWIQVAGDIHLPAEKHQS